MAEQQAQAKFRSMIFELSGGLDTSNCESICYLAGLPTLDCLASRGKTNLPLLVLSSLEANGLISPWDVEKLESLLFEIHHNELLPIVAHYKVSKEYKDALKERKRKKKKKKATEENRKCNPSGDNATGSSEKRRLRSLYTLLITHVTGLTQIMEIIREELDKIGDEGGDVAMERFFQVAKDGESFTDDLRKVFQDMGINSNRNSTSSSTSSEETPATTPNGDVETRDTNVSSPQAIYPQQQSPATSAKLPQKKPMPLPRTKKGPQARQDLDIYENLGPIKQEEGSDVSLEEYHRSVLCMNKVESTSGLDGEEEDITGNTGDSGISEWTGHRTFSERNLLDAEKDGCPHRAHSEGDMLDSTPSKDRPHYTTLLRTNEPASEYASVRYGDNMHRS